jgi:hypothetical protein
MSPASRSVTIAAALLTLAACSRSNNVLLGRVEADINGHRVAVTDCYQFYGIPEPQKLGEGSYRYAPCKDSVVTLQGNSLFVNGTAYGDLAADDSVTVNHGKVLINGISR